MSVYEFGSSSGAGASFCFTPFDPLLVLYFIYYTTLGIRSSRLDCWRLWPSDKRLLIENAKWNIYCTRGPKVRNCSSVYTRRNFRFEFFQLNVLMYVMYMKLTPIRMRMIFCGHNFFVSVYHVPCSSFYWWYHLKLFSARIIQNFPFNGNMSKCLYPTRPKGNVLLTYF